MEYLSLDADHLGHLHVEMDKYRSKVIEEFETAELGIQDAVAEMEHIGWLMAKIDVGMLIPEELEMIERRIGEIE